ncbi:hypothetical protein BDQ17DRAFT_1433259 [Cyathus striatus]|nr:hypothetical protein BDQ17DRAFT_1433259 [Cyathus striatus]
MKYFPIHYNLPGDLNVSKETLTTTNGFSAKEPVLDHFSVSIGNESGTKNDTPSLLADLNVGSEVFGQPQRTLTTPEPIRRPSTTDITVQGVPISTEYTQWPPKSTGRALENGPILHAPAPRYLNLPPILIDMTQDFVLEDADTVSKSRADDSEFSNLFAAVDAPIVTRPPLDLRTGPPKAFVKPDLDQMIMSIWADEQEDRWVGRHLEMNFKDLVSDEEEEEEEEERRLFQDIFRVVDSTWAHEEGAVQQFCTSRETNSGDYIDAEDEEEARLLFQDIDRVLVCAWADEEEELQQFVQAREITCGDDTIIPNDVEDDMSVHRYLKSSGAPPGLTHPLAHMYGVDRIPISIAKMPRGDVPVRVLSPLEDLGFISSVYPSTKVHSLTYFLDMLY